MPVLSLGGSMRRREFIKAIGSVAAWPFVARAQQSGTLPRVGILEPYAATDPGYRMGQALHDLGIEEDRDIVVEWRYAGGQIERIPTPTTPIIAGTDDLVGEGHVASLAHPGSNVTGISVLASELNAKRLEVLKEAAPSVSRVAVLWDPATGSFHLPTLRSVAEMLRVELQVHDVTGGEVLSKAFEAARAWGANGLNVLASPLLHALRQPIIDQAAAHRLPAIYQWGESARAGGLMSYGPFRNDVYQAIAR